MLYFQIVAVSLAVRHHLAAHTSVKVVRFITNYLFPPPKRAVLAHLSIPFATGEEVRDEDRVPIIRKAEVDVSPAPQIILPCSRVAGIVSYMQAPPGPFDPLLRGSHLVRLNPTCRRDYFTRRKCNLGVARDSLSFVNPIADEFWFTFSYYSTLTSPSLLS
jgi:hypothetical protein